MQIQDHLLVGCARDTMAPALVAEANDVATYRVKALSVEGAGVAHKLIALEEEKFEDGMRNNAIDFESLDDGDRRCVQCRGRRPAACPSPTAIPSPPAAG